MRGLGVCWYKITNFQLLQGGVELYDFSVGRNVTVKIFIDDPDNYYRFIEEVDEDIKENYKIPLEYGQSAYVLAMGGLDQEYFSFKMDSYEANTLGTTAIVSIIILFLILLSLGGCVGKYCCKSKKNNKENNKEWNNLSILINDSIENEDRKTENESKQNY